jgi:hypothetical protein
MKSRASGNGEDSWYDLDGADEESEDGAGPLVTINSNATKIVSEKAADAAMVLADPNTHHSLAKMMWDVLVMEVFNNKEMPREIPSVSNLVWFLKLGQDARDIVKACLDHAVSPPTALSDGPPKKTKLDFLLHRALPLCSLLCKRNEVDFVVPPKLLQYCQESPITRELYLRFVCLQIRGGDERVAMSLIPTVEDMAGHPGFRRGLSYVLKDAQQLMTVRKFAIEHIFLSHIRQLSPEGKAGTNNEIETKNKELADAHEFLAVVIGSKATMKLFIEAGDTVSLAEYVTQALKGINPILYLSSTFRGARQYYEQFFANENFAGYRDSIGLPIIPAGGSGGNRDMSPGSIKPSPSPGTLRPQSASPQAYRSTGPQSVSPSFGSPLQ